MITRTSTVNIKLTAAELATEFANMDEEPQAIFFNELANIVSEWKNGIISFEMQMIAVEKSPILTEDAKSIMRIIGEVQEL